MEERERERGRFSPKLCWICRKWVNFLLLFEKFGTKLSGLYRGGLGLLGDIIFHFILIKYCPSLGAIWVPPLTAITFMYVKCDIIQKNLILQNIHIFPQNHKL